MGAGRDPAKKGRAKVSATRIQDSARRAAARSGRPPAKRAGEVEERILGAARRVFLERGFEAASIEEIAAAARSGKPTIYARFPNKKALFAAAVTRYAFATLSRLEEDKPSGATLQERLVNIGAGALREVLTGEWIGLLRLAISEARRFPDLGVFVIRSMRERGGESMARRLGKAAESDAEAWPAFRPDRLSMTARCFVDLILLPQLLRALLGEPLETLHAETGPHVLQRVTFFLDACRHADLS
ncbi:MAG TPA: TetR/AcrR family transcriptional regulator [Roseiarcus sp.]